MRTGVHEVREDEPIARALQSMCDAEVGVLLVVDRAGGARGVVSKTDLLEHFADRGALDAEIGSVTSRELFTVDADAQLTLATRRMADEGVHHLIVLDGGAPVGVLGAWDLVRAAAEGRVVVRRGDARVLGPRSGPGV